MSTLPHTENAQQTPMLSDAYMRLDVTSALCYDDALNQWRQQTGE